ncbi:oxidoreductase [Nocardioides sp.]|uniref:oxidoreductase n=1 Tax=Nocardioides sp. TaxID=35761 RepID=UPI0035170B5D
MARPTRPSRVRPWRVVPDQQGRRIVVTGANSGVGLATAAALARAGGDVVLACRSPERGEQALAGLGLPAEVRARTQVRALDLSSLASVASFAQEVAADGGCDVVVNNAGIMAVPFGRSADGVELQLATNHLGHFALTLRLLPVLRDRVVVVSSQAHRQGVLDLDDLDWTRRGYQPFGAYAASKLANLLFLGELQRRLTASGSRLRAVGAHPGTTASGITGHTGNGLLSRVGAWGHRLVGMAPDQGALPQLYAATMDVPGNTYLGPHALGEMRGWPVPVGRAQAALDPDLARRLWSWSEERSGLRFPDR